MFFSTFLFRKENIIFLKKAFIFLLLNFFWSCSSLSDIKMMVPEVIVRKSEQPKHYTLLEPNQDYIHRVHHEYKLNNGIFVNSPKIRLEFFPIEKMLNKEYSIIKRKGSYCIIFTFSGNNKFVKLKCNEKSNHIDKFHNPHNKILRIVVVLYDICLVLKLLEIPEELLKFLKENLGEEDSINKINEQLKLLEKDKDYYFDFEIKHENDNICKLYNLTRKLITDSKSFYYENSLASTPESEGFLNYIDSSLNSKLLKSPFEYLFYDNNQRKDYFYLNSTCNLLKNSSQGQKNLNVVLLLDKNTDHYDELIRYQKDKGENQIDVLNIEVFNGGTLNEFSYINLINNKYDRIQCMVFNIDSNRLLNLKIIVFNNFGIDINSVAIFNLLIEKCPNLIEVYFNFLCKHFSLQPESGFYLLAKSNISNINKFTITLQHGNGIPLSNIGINISSILTLMNFKSSPCIKIIQEKEDPYLFYKDRIFDYSTINYSTNNPKKPTIHDLIICSILHRSVY